MKNVLSILVISLFVASLAACGSAPVKMDEMPAEAPATAPAEMPAEMPATAPAEGGEEGEGEEGEEGEGDGEGDGAEAPKTRALKKFDGNRMERAADEGDDE